MQRDRRVHATRLRQADEPVDRRAGALPALHRVGGFRHAHRLDPVKRHARHSTRQRSWQDEQGANHTVIEMQLDEIGPSLRYATAQVTRISRQQGHQPAAGGYTGGASFGATVPTAGPQAPATDPWGQPTDGGAAFGAFGTPGDDVEKEPEF